MSLASPRCFQFARRRSGGRPRDADNPAKRAKQYRWAYLVLSGQALVREAAAANGVDRHTITRWIKALLASGEPEAEGLRRVIDEPGA